mgnify:CR=1 FL=1
MKVVICAGEKTDHICNYLKAKSSLSIEPIQSVLDVISRIESSGFIADKVVIFGFALDNVGEDKDLDDVFDSLTQIASEAIDNKELLIVNRGTKGRDYDRYFFKYMQGLSHARFDRSPELVMRDLERIISGSSNARDEQPSLTLPKKEKIEVAGEQKKKEKKVGLAGLFGKKKGAEIPKGEQSDKKTVKQEKKSPEPVKKAVMQERPVPVNDDSSEKETEKKISFGAVEFDSVTAPSQSLGISLDEGLIDEEDEVAKEIEVEEEDEPEFETEPEPEVEPAPALDIKPQQRSQTVKQAPPSKPRDNAEAPKEQTQKGPVKKGFGPLDIVKSKPKQKKEEPAAAKPAEKKENKSISKPADSRTRFKPDEDKIAEMQKRSKIVIVTGNNRSGKSSMIANLAYVAQAVGISTLILDMDLRGRGMSLLFPQDINPEENYYTNGISNAMRSPYAYTDFTWEVTDTLSILGMDISVGDIAMHEDVLDNAKLAELLAVVRTQHDLVLIDMPVHKLKDFGCAVSLADRIAYVTENDVSSLVNIINNMGLDMFSTIVDFQMFRSKCGFIINRYNPTCTLSENVIDPQNLTLFLDRISEDGEFSGFPVYGAVEDVMGFSKQMDGGHLLCESSGFDRLFFDMLYCLYR